MSVSFMRLGALQGLGVPRAVRAKCPPVPRTGCDTVKDPLSVCFVKPGGPVLAPGRDRESDSQTKMKLGGESFL